MTGAAAAWHRLGATLGAHGERNVAIVLGVATAVWLLDVLVPTFGQIPQWDETGYMRSGWRLVDEGALRDLAWGPFISFVYGLAYLAFQESPNWFVWTAAGGRLATYVLFCLGMYLCSRTLSDEPARSPAAGSAARHAALVIGLTWPLAASFFAGWNSSDFLFIALSALALSRLLAWLSDRSLRHLLWGSVLVGLAGLTRPDGLILLATFVVMAFATAAREGRTLRPPGWRKLLAASLLPGVLVIGGYQTVYGTATGGWGTGVMARTYTAFEQGHGVIFRERYPHQVTMVAGYDDVRASFGTRADNGASVLRAIARNPVAFAERLAYGVADMPLKFTRAFGGPLTVVLLFLAARGAVLLWRSTERWKLVVMVGWHFHVLSYFVTFWRPGYVRFAFVALALLAGHGAVAIVRNWRDWRETVPAALVLLGTAGWLWWDAEGTLWSDPGVRISHVGLALGLGMALWLPTLAVRRRLRPHGTLPGLLAALVAVSAVAAAAGRSPTDLLSPRVGLSPEEGAVAAATRDVPPGVHIATAGARVPTAARRPVRDVGGLMRMPVSRSGFDRWERTTDAGAVYLHPWLHLRYGEWFEFLLATFRNDPTWVTAFSDPAAHTWLFVRRPLLDVEDVWNSQVPALRSDFDVFVLDRLLVYVKHGAPSTRTSMRCEREGGAKRFFVHVAPVDTSLLPAGRRTASMNFRFERNGFQAADGRCVAMRALPGYEIDYIETGQYIPGDRRLWEGRIEFDDGRPAGRTWHRGMSRRAATDLEVQDSDG